MRIPRGASLLSIVLPVVWSTASLHAQDDPRIDRQLEALRQPGPDAREAREAAIDALLLIGEPRAHAPLQAAIGKPAVEDADGVATAVLVALARHLRLAADPVFGTAADPKLRSQLLLGYLPNLVDHWRGEPDANGELPRDPRRDLARTCVVRIPVADLDRGLRTLVTTHDPLAVLRCAADSQQLVLGRFLAEFLAHERADLRAAAHAGLRQLTFETDGFANAAAFAAWYEVNQERRYLDLAEQAARRQLRAAGAFARQLADARRQAVVDFVRLQIERRPGIDWTALEQVVFAADAAAAAALEQLRASLAITPQLDDSGAGRAAFLRQVLQRLGAEPPRPTSERAGLLEVAGYLCRPEDGELPALVQRLLLQALDDGEPTLQLAAVRGLRRLPNPETRAAVIAFALAARSGGEPQRPQLEAALATLACRTPVWTAPQSGDLGYDGWLALLDQLLTDVSGTQLRDKALALALLPDGRGGRLGDAFSALLRLAKDPAVDAEFRATCLIHLQDWRDDPLQADRWVTEIARLLDDASQDVRLFAANALANLPEVAERQAAWRAQVTLAMRARLRVEAAVAVVRAMCECLVTYAQQAEASALVIGALAAALEEMPHPLPADHVVRAEPLLQALTTVAVDARTVAGQWAGACTTLLRFEKRRSLRHVLTSHGAAGLLSQVQGVGDEAELARRVASLILGTALLKPGKESWTGSDELRAEVQDVRSAFAALANAPELLRPEMRLLRLEVDLAVGKTKDVIAQAQGCLQPGPDDGNVNGLSAAQKDAVRLLLAEAFLLENKLEPAAAALRERDGAALEPRALEAMERLGRGLLAGADAAGAAVWLDRVVKATADEDPAFRRRFLAWAQAAAQDPAGREAVLAAMERRVALFEAADCPAELRNAFAVLRGK